MLSLAYFTGTNMDLYAGGVNWIVLVLKSPAFGASCERDVYKIHIFRALRIQLHSRGTLLKYEVRAPNRIPQNHDDAFAILHRAQCLQ